MRVVRVPIVSSSMTNIQVCKVLVRCGESVQRHTPLVEFETDKAVFTVNSPAAGVVHQIHVRRAQKVEERDAL